MHCEGVLRSDHVRVGVGRVRAVDADELHAVIRELGQTIREFRIARENGRAEVTKARQLQHRGAEISTRPITLDEQYDEEDFAFSRPAVSFGGRNVY